MNQLNGLLAGFQMSLLPNVEAYWLENPRFAPTDWCPTLPRQTRRKQSTGWIEQRNANPKRASPTTCYYFCWYETQNSTRRKCKTYIPQNKVLQVCQLVRVEKRPYIETLQAIGKVTDPFRTGDPIPMKQDTDNHIELVTLAEAARTLGRGFSRRSILRRIDSGEWVEGQHWIDDRRTGATNRQIKINLTAVMQWRTRPAAKR